MISRVDEFNRNDIIRGTDKKNIERSKKVPSVSYIGITEDYTVLEKARSATTPGVTYDIRIKLLDYPEIADEEDLSVRDKVRLAIAGNLHVSCSCPAFKWWGYEYISTQLGIKDGEPQAIYPHIRNPKLEGVVCKHLYKALQVFPLQYMRIVSDISKGRFIRE